MSKKSKKASRKKQKKSSVKVRLPYILILIAMMVFGGYFFYNQYNQTTLAQHLNNTVDIEALKGGETRPTLTPALFTGKVAGAYNLARQNRELLDSIYCYCNCKKTIGHKSLLSCYVDRHAANCNICRDQTFYADSRYRKGDDIAQVRFAVDKRFWRPLR